MSNPLLVIESVSEPKGEDDADKKKDAAAEDLLAAIKDNNLDATKEALTAFYRLCALDD